MPKIIIHSFIHSLIFEMHEIKCFFKMKFTPYFRRIPSPSCFHRCNLRCIQQKGTGYLHLHQLRPRPLEHRMLWLMHVENQRLKPTDFIQCSALRFYTLPTHTSSSYVRSFVRPFIHFFVHSYFSAFCNINNKVQQFVSLRLPSFCTF